MVDDDELPARSGEQPTPPTSLRLADRNDDVGTSNRRTFDEPPDEAAKAIRRLDLALA